MTDNSAWDGHPTWSPVANQIAFVSDRSGSYQLWTMAADGSNQQQLTTGLNRVAFPMGGMGAGMICLEGTGALSHVSLRNKPEVFHEPCTFGAICVKGQKNLARVLEGPVPAWKLFGQPATGNGAAGSSFGLPRFREAAFRVRLLDLAAHGFGAADGEGVLGEDVSFSASQRSRATLSLSKGSEREG